MKTLSDFKVQKNLVAGFYYIPICDFDVSMYVTFDSNALEFCQILNEISYVYGVRTSKIYLTMDNSIPGFSIYWNFADCEREPLNG